MTIPDIQKDIEEGYAKTIAHNYDTLQECYKAPISKELEDKLEAAKKIAQERHEGQGVFIGFGGEDFQIWSGSSQGCRWVLENDDLQLHIASPKLQWCINVRYKSAGLWEHGVKAMRDRVECLLINEFDLNPEFKRDWCTLTRVDYAFDFYSPKLTIEMDRGALMQNMVLTSGVKFGVVGTSKCHETLTIGMRRAGVQIQLYDKGKEIDEASGKNWMHLIYRRAGIVLPIDEKPRHIWRLEVRFGKEFLKDRNIRFFDDFEESHNKLISEALMRRRVIRQDERFTQHKERAPLHPLWAQAWHEAGACGEYVPIGRQITKRKEEYKEILIKQYMGLARTISVLDNGFYDTEEFKQISDILLTRVSADKQHFEKVQKTLEKMRFINEAR